MNPSPDAESLPVLENIRLAAERLKNVVPRTPFTLNANLSERYGASVYLKREDQQIVRSYKVRGAYNKMVSLPKELLQKGVVCASAGNHAQGVAFACRKMEVKGTIFMPTTTPTQKIQQVGMFGKGWVDIRLTGDTFDDSYKASLEFCEETRSNFVHPFDDIWVIEGQGTVGLEILEDADFKIDYLILPVGGGGLASGVSAVFRELSPETTIIGVEPEGAPALLESLKAGKVIELPEIDKFVDGAAVKRVGYRTFAICRRNLDEVLLIPEGKVCTAILQLYNEQAIVAEPAGALSVAALDSVRDRIAGKNVVVVVSGGNNDITRTEEIRERSMLYEGLKHYFIIRFPQRAGALREFLNVLGPEDDIVRFEYIKKTNREQGPAMVGIELKRKEDYQPLIARMKKADIVFEYVNDRPDLFRFLV